MFHIKAPPISALPDYKQAFELAPIGLVLSRQRVIVDCNQRLAQIFGADKEELIGHSFAMLYPSPDEFDRMGLRLSAELALHGLYADNRIMKRVAGRLQGELFWCHVSGQTFNQSDPHAAGIWSFEDLSAQRPVNIKLTAREREVAAQIARGRTAKETAKVLGISHRTVELHRSRLLRKYRATSTLELAQKLMTPE